MRSRTAFSASCVALSCALIAHAQEPPKPAKGKSKSAPTATNSTSNAKDSDLLKQQAIFKDWAKGVRESVESGNRLANKKPAERQAWVARSWKTKEDKLRKRNRLGLYQLFLITKRGLAEQWPTEKPGDLEIIEPVVAQRQASLDATIFEEDLDAWVIENAPRGPATTSLRGAAAAIQQGAFDAAELRKRAPVTVCQAKTEEDKTCGREVVGERGRLCYEHRPGTDASR